MSKLTITAVIVTSVFLAIQAPPIFAQTNQEQFDPDSSFAELLAQSLAAQGYEVGLEGDFLEIATNRGELSLDLSAAGEGLENGISASLVPYDSTPVESIDDYVKLKRCLDAVDFMYFVDDTICKIGLDDLGTVICRTAALYERALDTSKCIALYAPQEPPGGDAVSVFVTESRYQGNFGGLVGADARCQLSAEAADLGGTGWTAWLSDSMENAIDRIPDGQYQLLDGTLVADDKADLTDGRLDAAISMNEFGETQPGWFVWTGTASDGTNTGNNCNDWTGSSGASGDRGVSNVNVRNSDWTQLIATPAQCSERYHLYCFGGVE